jgi:hypothetical protein
MKKKHNHSVFLYWWIFFKFKKPVFRFCGIIFLEEMSKISQFKIRKPKKFPKCFVEKSTKISIRIFFFTGLHNEMEPKKLAQN